MAGVRVSEHYGIIIRKDALETHSISRSSLSALIEADALFDEDEMLISFGPYVGDEAIQTAIGRLEQAGLRHGIDYLDVSDSLPDWLQLSVSMPVTSTGPSDGFHQTFPDQSTMSSERSGELTSDTLIQYLHHQWRAPIVAALGLSEVLQNPAAGALNQDQQELLKSLHRKLEQMNQGFLSLAAWLEKRQKNG